MKPTKEQPFDVLRVAHELVTEIIPIIRKVKKSDSSLARQMTNAVNSIPANLGEGNGRTGRDRRYHFTVAAGSARELDCQVRLAIAWGHVSEARCEAALALLDREHAMLWQLTH